MRHHIQYVEYAVPIVSRLGQEYVVSPSTLLTLSALAKPSPMAMANIVIHILDDLMLWNQMIVAPQ